VGNILKNDHLEEQEADSRIKLRNIAGKLFMSMGGRTGSVLFTVASFDINGFETWGFALRLLLCLHVWTMGA
jgi:hypothetical protein